MAPLEPARRGTRWIQGTITAASATVIIFATVSIAGRKLKPTDQTLPPAVPSAVLPEPTTALTDRPASARATCSVGGIVDRRSPAGHDGSGNSTGDRYLRELCRGVG